MPRYVYLCVATRILPLIWLFVTHTLPFGYGWFRLRYVYGPTRCRNLRVVGFSYFVALLQEVVSYLRLVTDTVSRLPVTPAILFTRLHFVRWLRWARLVYGGGFPFTLQRLLVRRAVAIPRLIPIR